MDPLKSIITHSGGAHKDEFIAVALILAGFATAPDVTVHRREPTDDELADPTIAVVDVGGRFQPQLMNFDHHQDGSLPCAAHLVANTLELETINIVYPWWDVMSEWDTKGPAYVEKTYKVNNSKILIDPVGKTVLQLFSQYPENACVIWMLRKVGESLLSGLNSFEEQAQIFKYMGKLKIYNGVKVFTAPTLPTHFDTWVKHEPANICHMTVFEDERSEGHTFYCYDRYVHLVNFKKLQDNPLIAFIHERGFLCRTNRKLTDQELEVFLLEVTSK